MATIEPVRLLKLAAIPLVMLCGACEPKRMELIKPPAALLTCASEPLAPDLPTKEQQAERDRLTLEYLLGLRSAWGDCSNKVAGIKAWSDGL